VSCSQCCAAFCFPRSSRPRPGDLPSPGEWQPHHPDGHIVGSELIGQSFSAPGYFHSRPSAAGAGYDGSGSSGTNLGPTSDKLINGIHKKLANGADDPGNYDGIKDLAAAYRRENGLSEGAPVPPDAVTRSASGLDPHISPTNAGLQAVRVAKARGSPRRPCAVLFSRIRREAVRFPGEPRSMSSSSISPSTRRPQPPLIPPARRHGEGGCQAPFGGLGNQVGVETHRPSKGREARYWRNGREAQGILDGREGATER